VLRLAAVARGPGEEAERVAALDRLAELGPEASAAAPVLIELISDPREMTVARRVQHRAVSSLVFMAPAYETVVPGLIRQISSRNGDIVVRALTMIGRPAVKPLLAVAQSRMAEHVRGHALDALGPIGDPDVLRPLARLIAADKSQWVRSKAAGALGGLGPAGAGAVGIIAAQLAKGRVAADSALITLGQIGPKARKALPVVMEKLRTGDERTRAFAAFAFLCIAGGKKGHDALAKELRGAPWVKMQSILFPIIEAGPIAAPAVPIVLGVLRDRNSKIRALGARALGAIGQRTPEIIAALRDARNTRDYISLVRSATTALALLGEVDRNWVHAAISSNRPELVVHRFERRQLVEMGEPVVRGLVRAIESPAYQPRQKWIAVRVLRDIGPDAAEALPSLEARFAERVPGRRYSWRDAIPGAVAAIRGKPTRRRR
jgi:HEAT repeat protein